MLTFKVVLNIIGGKVKEKDSMWKKKLSCINTVCAHYVY